MTTGPQQPAPERPYARVLPLVGVAHLDRLFDYKLTDKQHEDATPGVRLRVRFAGRLVDAFLIDRAEQPEYDGSLAWVDRVVSPEPVLSQETWELVQSLALRYGGTRSDVLRAVIPPRHAAAEKSCTSGSWESLGKIQEPDLSPWSSYAYGESFVDAVLGGAAARAAWQIAPGDQYGETLASLAVAVAKKGGGVLIVVPDHKRVEWIETALRQLVSAAQITVLESTLGPQARYRRFLSILHGQARIVVGTRAAAYAPVKNLRLAVIMDDGDENLVDPRAPYIHAREVLTTRAARTGCALLVAGYSRTAEAQLMVEAGWLNNLVSPRQALRGTMPRVQAAGDSDAALAKDPLARASRLPQVAYEAIRQALDREEPALILTPRSGYVPALACGHCRSVARCRTCHGPMELPASPDGSPVTPTCRWCGRPDGRFRCGECGSTTLRAVVVGTDRTAEELGRAFPGVPVTASGGAKIVRSIASGARIVAATPGAEPAVEIDGVLQQRGYGAAIFVDTWALLGRPDLRATEKALAAWMSAAAKVNAASLGGRVIVTADPALPVVQQLIRWDPVDAARRELEERRSADFPPAVHLVAVDGVASALAAFTQAAELPDSAELLGPVDLPAGVTVPAHYLQSNNGSLGPAQRLIIRVPLSAREELGHALRRAAARRPQSAPSYRVQVDPFAVG